MKYIRYSIGFIAGIFDGIAWKRGRNGGIVIRNWIIRRVAYTGDTINGFDASSDFFLRRYLDRQKRGCARAP